MVAEKLRPDNPNPWSKANVFSRLTFWWAVPLLLKCVKSNLKLKDIYDCPKEFCAERVGEILQREWEKELTSNKKGKKPSIFKAIARGVGAQMIWNGTVLIFERCVINVLQPLMLCFMIKEYSKMENASDLQLYMYAAFVCILSALFAIIYSQQVFHSDRISLKLQVAFTTLIYRKALKLSPSALKETNVGQMVNLLSKDISRIDQVIFRLPYLLVCPLMMIIVTAILWLYVGYSSIAGMSILILYTPLLALSGKVFSKFSMRIATLADERIRLMKEIISGMRVIKMYAWESPFAKLVDAIRRKEVKKIRHAAILRSICWSVVLSSSKVTLLIVFSVFVVGLQGELTPEKVFLCFAYFQFLELIVVTIFLVAVNETAYTIVSLKRIQKFLLLEEQEIPTHLSLTTRRPDLSHCGTWMSDVTTSWNAGGEPTLSNVTLAVNPGELLAIVGPVGCGKSSLLLSILGELPFSSGEVKIQGRVSYASQDPWIFSGSVKQNILFGSDFNENMYKTVVSACALDKDIEEFPNGEETEIDGQGLGLSGGQKSRISLARAIYFDADIYLLDDPLSAVDAEVSKHIFEKCINGYLKNKLRILVTHHIQFLKDATQILVLKEGKCIALDTYENLLKLGIDFGSLIEENKELNEKKLPSSLDLNLDYGAILPVVSTVNKPSLSDSSKKRSIDSAAKMKESAPRVEEEKKVLGAVKYKIYREYIISGAGLILQIVILVSLIAAQASSVGGDFWLTLWTKQEQRFHNIRECWSGMNKSFLSEIRYYRNSNYHLDKNIFPVSMPNISDYCFVLTNSILEEGNDVLTKGNTKYNLLIYACLVLCLFILSLIKLVAIFQMCTKASVRLHNRMFQNILRYPISFFESTPIGNILNRCSRDLSFIDDVIPIIAKDSLEAVFKLLGIMSVIAIVMPWLLIPSIVISSLFFICRRIYLPSVRDTKRYEGITRSPVFSHVSTCMHGLTTIRAFNTQQMLEKTFNHYQDQHTAAWFMFKTFSRMFCFALDSLSVIFVTVITIAMALFSHDPSYASVAGLAIASALQLFGDIQWGIRQSVEMESQMVSVERIIEYSNLKPEAALESLKEKKPPKNWPSCGHIIFSNVSLRYFKDEPLVLKNLNFEVHPNEKIGIVGRTGAGKSSLIVSLFRMTEPEGCIKIDCINIKEIGLHDLRMRISIVPQDPVLFSGPIRRNLDPFNEYTESDLWDALEKAYLKDYIKELPGGLDATVSEKGGNFSVGQRQLICLARAILRKNKILVLDEATANVDSVTDRLIQQTIKEHFSYCTVLTIAHRLHTVVDSDRILVLDTGEVKEFDEPHILLQDSNSYFSKLVQMTGEVTAQQLRKVARETYLQKGDTILGMQHHRL